METERITLIRKLVIHESAAAAAAATAALSEQQSQETTVEVAVITLIVGMEVTAEQRFTVIMGMGELVEVRRLLAKLRDLDHVVGLGSRYSTRTT